jgi:trimeric autotransporter adhesin
MTSLMTAIRAAAFVAGLAVASAALADDAANGAALYSSNCTGCHGSSPLTSNSNKIFNGRNARAVIDASITNVGAMNSLRAAFPAGSPGLADLAAYLGNTPTTLSFASTAVGSTSAAQNITVYASLKSGNAISNLTVSTSGDFTRSGGTCGTAVSTGTSCTIGVVFSPTTSGTHNGSLSIGHGNTLTPITFALSGSASGGGAPAASVSPASLAFGSTAIGSTSAAQSVTIANAGSAALSLSAANYSSPDFVTAGGTCTFPGSIAAGSSCVVSVAFNPGAGAPGARSGTLSIAHGATGSPAAVSLSGTAASAATPAASLTASLAFGSVTVGTTSAMQTATLSNTGNAALTVASIATGSGEFGIVGGTCSAGTSVAAGSSCTINVAFTPSTTGARSATLALGHDAAGGSSSAALSGTGVAQSPAANVSPASLSFAQTVGSTSAAQTITIANTGTAALTLGSFALSGPQAAEFQIAGGGTCAAGGNVAPSSSCTLHVTFAPTAVGTRSAALSIAHNASGSPASVALGGTGTSSPQPAIALNAASLTFGAQAIGTTSSAQNVTVTNSGAAALTLGSMTFAGAASADFARGGTCVPAATLAAGATCSVALTFTPGATGARSATLTIASDATNGSAVLSLSGTGAAAAAPAVSAAPAALDFGNQTIGVRSAARSVVLTNSGSGALSIAGITAGSPYAVASDCGASLNAGSSCTLSVTFTPAGGGAANGSVSIASNAAGAPHAVALTGTGVTSAPALAWTPTTTALDFGNADVGGTAATRTLTLTNQGPGATTLQQITVAGPQAGEFAVGAGSTCAAGLSIAQGASCGLTIGFHPSAAGGRAATLQLMSSGTNPPDVAMSGIGNASSQAQLAVLPPALNFTAAATSTASKQELMLENSGSAVLRVSAVRVAAGNFTLEAATSQPCQAAPFDLMPAQTCRVVVAWSGDAADTGAIEVDSTAAGGTLSVPLTAALDTAPTATAISNVGNGGCSIAGRSDGIDPTLWLLVALALFVLWRRAGANPSPIQRIQRGESR